MCSATSSIGKGPSNSQGIAGMDGPVAGPHRSRLTMATWLLDLRKPGWMKKPV